jgi:hypothetical protein
LAKGVPAQDLHTYEDLPYYYGRRRGHTYMDCVVQAFALIEECRSVYQAEYLGTFQQGNLGRTRSEMEYGFLQII